MFDFKSEAILNFHPERVMEAVDKASWEAAVKTAVDIENDARDLVPVKTGKLRDSIRVTVGKVDGLVVMEAYTTSGYGGYVELGTFKTRAQPFMRPAINKNFDKLRQRMKEGLK